MLVIKTKLQKFLKPGLNLSLLCIWYCVLPASVGGWNTCEAYDMAEWYVTVILSGWPLKCLGRAMRMHKGDHHIIL
jgi:hypothetical protein